MGNSNSSHRHRPHITDPLPMDPAAWSSQSTYPGNNFKGPPRPMMMQQQPHPSGGPDTVDGPRSMGVIRNGRSSSYDQFDQECMIQQQQSHPDARFARYVLMMYFHALRILFSFKKSWDSGMPILEPDPPIPSNMICAHSVRGFIFSRKECRNS